MTEQRAKELELRVALLEEKLDGLFGKVLEMHARSIIPHTEIPALRLLIFYIVAKVGGNVDKVNEFLECFVTGNVEDSLKAFQQEDSDFGALIVDHPLYNASASDRLPEPEEIFPN